MTGAATPARQRPVVLQVNNTGAWKTIVRFDLENEFGCLRVLDAADALGMVDQGAALTFRVIMDDASPSPKVMMRWSRADSWQDVVRS